LVFLQELFGDEWVKYVIPGKKSMARYLGIQPIVLTKEQQEAEEKRKKEVLDKFLNSLKKK
jgi:hypothetical protein